MNDNLSNKSKNNKKVYALGLILAVLLVAVITYSTYAYFTATVNGVSNNTVITSGNMAIDFTDGPEVGLNGALPGQYIEKTFSVSNTGNIDTYYDVFLSDLVNTFEDKTDLVYTLTSIDGGQNVTESEIPSTSTKIVTSKSLPANATHNYILRIEFKETNDNQDDNKGKLFSSVVRINEVQEAKMYRVISGDLNIVGSVVQIANEDFYVIGQEDDNHVKLLSKWNLNVGEHAKGTATGLQDSDVIGYVYGVSSYGTDAYSNTNYWMNGSNLKEEYGSSYPAYVYDSNASIKTYVDRYVTYLTNQGVNVTGRLISFEELEGLGCNSTTYSCSSSNGGTAPEWVYQTSYWTGSTYNASSDISYVNAGGSFSSYAFYNSATSFGVRPVIILEK